MNKRRNGNFAVYIIYAELIVLRTGLIMHLKEWILYYNNKNFSDFAYERYLWALSFEKETPFSNLKSSNQNSPVRSMEAISPVFGLSTKI
jgi:hypothetical protein